MIKPDAVIAGNTGAITKMIEEAGFKIQAMKKTRLTQEVAGQFYSVHKERPFLPGLMSIYVFRTHSRNGIKQGKRRR